MGGTRGLAAQWILEGIHTLQITLLPWKPPSLEIRSPPKYITGKRRFDMVLIHETQKLGETLLD